jgi:NhaP-type Na+/H+ or K+/H+ antiporter
VIDLLTNSSFFVYFGTIIPWSAFASKEPLSSLSLSNLFLYLILVLLFRRIPIVLAIKRFIPDIRTYREALFSGHFGPIGVGALFLAMEARKELEKSSSRAMPDSVPHASGSEREKEVAAEMVWPVICFVVLGSTMVHGLSVAAITVSSHYTRKTGERAPLIGGETEGLDGMVHDEGNGDSASDTSGEDEYA